MKPVELSESGPRTNNGSVTMMGQSTRTLRLNGLTVTATLPPKSTTLSCMRPRRDPASDDSGKCFPIARYNVKLTKKVYTVRNAKKPGSGTCSL